MKNYYLNKTANDEGIHVVHCRGCKYLALIARKVGLGTHRSCKTAIKKAKGYYKNIDGCFYCCPSCFNG